MPLGFAVKNHPEMLEKMETFKGIIQAQREVQANMTEPELAIDKLTFFGF